MALEWNEIIFLWFSTVNNFYPDFSINFFVILAHYLIENGDEFRDEFVIVDVASRNSFEK